MKTVLYPAIFHPEDVGYSVSVPDISGCFTEGDTLEEAYKNTVEAIGLNLDECKVFPVASNPLAIELNKGDFVSLIEFDALDYKRRHDTRAVKKTLTVPSWLNAEAEAQHINFSSVLQSALKQQLHIE